MTKKKDHTHLMNKMNEPNLPFNGCGLCDPYNYEFLVPSLCLTHYTQWLSNRSYFEYQYKSFMPEKKGY